MSQTRLGLGAIAVAGIAMAIAVGAPTANAAVGDAYLDACLNAGASNQAPCTAAPGLTGAYREASAPNGRQLYVVVSGGPPPRGGADEAPAVLIYDRDPATGRLTRRTTVSSPQFSNPQDIVVSPDGASVYVSDAGTKTITQFNRAADGGLSPGGACLGAGTGCTAVTGMGVAHALGVSPDGTSVYLRTSLGSGSGSLLVFDRAANGALTQKPGTAGCWTEVSTAGCFLAAGISLMSWQIAVTNANVYVTGRNDGYTYFSFECGWVCPHFQPATGSIAVFARGGDGSLTQAPGTAGGCISSDGTSGGTASGAAPVRCVDGRDALTDARSVTASPDGKAVYVGTASGIIAYTRGAGGALTDAGCLQLTGGPYLACAEAPGLGEVYRMSMTPSGDQVLAASATANGVAFLDRNTSTNALTPRSGTRGCLTSDGALGACETLAPLGGIGDVAVSPDGRSFYAVARNNGLLATLHPDAAPSCVPRTVDVPYQVSIAVPLACSDPNGDTLTLAVADQPHQGSLGGGGSIDPAQSTVRYNPPLGFSGTDSFTYRASAQGVDSAPATVTLRVGSPPPPPAADADGDGVLAGTDCNDHDAAIHPGAREIPGNAVDENCDGRAALLPMVAAKIRPAWKVAGAKLTLTRLTITKVTKGWKATLRCRGKGCPFRTQAFKALRKPRTFHAGQTLELRIAAPGHRTKVVRWVLKRGKTPRMR